jgi:site-specific DNA recombinase
MIQTVRAAIYARISRDVTGEGLGVERQLVDCRKIAADRGWKISEEYVDNDISAYGGKRRPGYERMLEDIAAGQRDAVIVYNTDRLTRRPIELEQFTAVCEAAGVRQLVAVTGDIDLGNDDGMFMARVLAAVAAKESGRKSERLRRKALESAEAGRPNGGVRPFGYEKDQMTVVESEAAVIRELADRFLAGEATASLTRWLQEQQIPTTRGAQWQTSTVAQVLKSPRIAGLRSHNGTVIGDALWPEIISPEQHRQIVAMYGRKTPSGKRSPRRYLLSGMLRCGKCGNKLYSVPRKETRRYVCQSGPDHGGCGGLTIVAAPVEEWLAEAVLMRIDGPAMRDAIAGRAAADERSSALLAELQEDKAQMDEHSHLWGSKVISSAEWKSAREPIEARIYAAERQLSQITGDHALDGILGRGDELRSSWESLPLTRQAAIVAAVLDYGTIAPAPTRKGPGVDLSRVSATWRL